MIFIKEKIKLYNLSNDANQTNIYQQKLLNIRLVALMRGRLNKFDIFSSIMDVSRVIENNDFIALVLNK